MSHIVFSSNYGKLQEKFLRLQNLIKINNSQTFNKSVLKALHNLYIEYKDFGVNFTNLQNVDDNKGFANRFHYFFTNEIAYIANYIQMIQKFIVSNQNMLVNNTSIMKVVEDNDDGLTATTLPSAAIMETSNDVIIETVNTALTNSVTASSTPHLNIDVETVQQNVNVASDDKQIVVSDNEDEFHSMSDDFIDYNITMPKTPDVFENTKNTSSDDNNEANMDSIIDSLKMFPTVNLNVVPPTNNGTIVSYRDAYNEFVKLGSVFNLEHLQNFKYEFELIELLKMTVPMVDKVGDEFTLSRLQCAAIIAQALFYNNVTNLDFITFKQGAILNKTLQVKLLCIFEYLNNICLAIRHYDKSFVNNKIVVTHCKSNSDNNVKSSNVPLRYDNITIDKYDYNFKYNSNTVPSMIDLSIMYADRTYGNGSMTHAVHKEALQFCEHVELYALRHYLIGELRSDTTILIQHVIKSNVVKQSQRSIEFIENIFEDGIVSANFLVTMTSDVKYDLKARDYDKTYMMNQINRLAAGFFRFKMYTNDNLTQVYIGPFGAKQNRILQFFTELAPIMNAGFGIKYCSYNQEDYDEIVRALESMKNKYIDVKSLVEALLNYKTNLSALQNFK
ncbi:poly ADP-ribose glycohydrolase [Ectropis obliqua nucleopolyhedrovirus]|uniref:Poly ADP-ribose glycohydrolase n=1 Tax=Ectropis obliqua nucleopolyhedrovirus TaxID=59376 RepID=A0EZ16_9ABAC|nr:poly ADP-ribose glycohydrolase [Ectropis obliqua nucleopolyhedrovirus]ABI35796.1 poly ADP-ribose glycohydrolase [Ectropis obliqua nucleopolyhedrovirus]AGS47956.1 hypothetical protein wdlz-06GM123 [Ectropis obliqua nucleopolyhedrovirus]QWV59620.1 poly ADP-ribose glycohydrolase [Ectropis obliqua nucleopolyhedrovirus]UYO72909.1 poly ADP-ribose glycohydrolase [Ectropis obliqua nucleopolyhedrovirus]